VERERGKGRGEIHLPSTPTQELLNRIPYDSWWRMREEKGRRRKMRTF
jgi:hypothetical protein